MRSLRTVTPHFSEGGVRGIPSPKVKSTDWSLTFVNGVELRSGKGLFLRQNGFSVMGGCAGCLESEVSRVIVVGIVCGTTDVFCFSFSFKKL